MARKESKTDAKRPEIALGADDAIFDKRAMLVGLLIACALGALGVIWRVASNSDSYLHKGEPKNFAFSMAKPKVENFTIREPIREIVHDPTPQKMEVPQAMEAHPDVHITTVERDAVVTTEVIQNPKTDFNTEQKEFKIDPKDLGVGAKQETTIPDAPERIDVVSDTVSFPLQPIATVSKAPADLFKYSEPSPVDKPQTYTIAQAPAPGRPMKQPILPPAYGDQNAPSMGKLGPVNINLFGGADVFRHLTQGGGMKARTAVDGALHWLAIHQSEDGTWQADKFEGAKQGTLADTGFAVLALMGGGNTSRKGEYSRNVLKGLEAIMRHQKEDGHITAGDNLYTHAICTIALCEAYGRARDERVGAAAQKAIAFCESAAGADGGWRYGPKPPASDTSVTAWFIQAFKTAKLAQIKSDHQVFSQAMSFLDSVTDAGGGKDSNGAVGYMAAEKVSNGHPALTAAGMVIRQFSGMGVRNPLLVKGAELTKAMPPRWETKNFYYWYYATYAMHNMGGEYRLFWNQKIRDVLIEHQSRDGDNSGSWDPKDDSWAKAGGRPYTTALGALCLEVYYRYSEALNSFGAAPDLDEVILQE